ncbi:hypothetical protein [Peribacillus frigoritolerans]|uniref:hypothetical protein n=1 Tax=Peribacillus frigoritolerans TaxID=450367 RepID=UPI0022825440|nr:hypothetical protein [Peribacillus frigoritolerans]MCY9137615.1 hypothetical protein [Peribacillus frigoritolerans]
MSIENVNPFWFQPKRNYRYEFLLNFLPGLDLLEFLDSPESFDSFEDLVHLPLLSISLQK